MRQEEKYIVRAVLQQGEVVIILKESRSSIWIETCPGVGEERRIAIQEFLLNEGFLDILEEI